MKATHPACGKSWTGYHRQHCEVCHETFNSTTPGDMHRVGSFTPRSARRCLTRDEMIELGMFEKDGIWYSGHRSVDALSRSAPENLTAEQSESIPQ